MYADFIPLDELIAANVYQNMSVFPQKVSYSIKPTIEWGPALVKHREEVAKYTPGFVVDPWNTEEHKNTVSPNDVALQVSMKRLLI